MLTHDAVREGRIVFRFVVGSLLIRSKPPKMAARKMILDERWNSDYAALERELAEHSDDIVQLDAIDGPGVAMECPAAEKTIQWMRYAQRAWPTALYYGKTEDDTYISIGALEHELVRLTAMRLPNVLYGLFGVCAMPGAARAERSPAGYKACFLGALERLGWITGGYRTIADWRRGGGGSGGVGSRRNSKCAPGSTEPAPFPTGPLMIASASLANTVFASCDYLQRFFARGRETNRRTLCRGHEKMQSWASLVGDCAIGHWVSKCARGHNITIAHMTYTKAHHYSTNSGGQGWVAPSNASIAVHWLKRHTGPSGPKHNEGGEWAHAHEAASAANGPGFPPLLWRYEPHNVLKHSRLLEQALNADVHEWYARSCSVWHEPTSAHVARLRARLENCSGESRVRGTPASWPFYGCHPSRGYAHPVWPPATELDEKSRRHRTEGSSAESRLPLATHAFWCESPRNQGGSDFVAERQ